MKEKWHGRGPWSGVFGPWNGNGKWGTGGTGAPHPYMRLPLKSDSRSKGPLRLGEPTSVSRTEDFTSYTEVDPGADITVAADTITFTALPRNVTSYVYQDFGTDYWSGDFEHRVKVNMSSTGTGIAHTLMFANSVDDAKGIDDATGDYLSVYIFAGCFRIQECNGGSLKNGEAYAYSTSTDYYLRFRRVEADSTYGTVYLDIYSDVGYSALLSTVSVELRAKKDYRYLYSLNSHNDANAETATGTVSNLQLDTATYFDGNLVVKADGGEARFGPDGYLDEPESTNLLLSSRVIDVDDANWSGTVAAEDCVQNAVGIDGVANTAWTVTDDDGVALEYISQTVSKAADDATDYTVSLSIGVTTGATVFPRLGIRFVGDTNDYSLYQLNTNTGQTTAVLVESDNCSVNVERQGDFWRMSVTGADNDANTSVGLYFFITSSGAETGSHIIDWAQLENASVASSPIYTTSTAVTRPADSFSLTMTDEFKAHFAEALGSELAPDFGVVLGPELITDENDRTFKDGDVGNWSEATDGTGTRAYNTDSIGGHDGAQLKITAGAGDDVIYAQLSIPGFTETIDSNAYYLLTGRVYLDPNANQDEVRFFLSSLSDSTRVVGNVTHTVNKGVWEDIYVIYEIVTDTIGTISMGFYDVGNLTANDIAYFDNISLRKITFSDDWTAGDGWGPKFALTAPSLGDEELSNGDFSSVTEGSDLFDSGVGDYRDNTGSWNPYDNNTVANDSDALLITWVDNAAGAYHYLQDSTGLSADLESGHQYRLTFSAKVESGETVTFGVYDGTSYHNNEITETSFTEYVVDFVALSGGPFPMRCSNMDASNDKIWVRDFTIKEITLDDHAVTGTRDATAYLEYDTDNDRLRVVSDGDVIGASQDTLVVGELYYYLIDVESVVSGSVRLVNQGCKAYDKPVLYGAYIVEMGSAGVYSGVFEAGNTVVSLIRNTGAGDDVTINSWSIKPYTPSHANTDPRFDRQTEGSDVLGGDGDCATDFMTEKGTGWSHDAGNGEYDCDGSQSDTSNLRKASVVTQNVRYKITFTVSNYSTGNVRVYPGGSGGEIGTWRSSDGTFTEYLTSKAAAASFYIQADADFTGSVDDIAVIPVTLSDYTGNNWYPADENGGAIHVAGESGFVYQTVGVTDTHYMFLWKHSGRTSGSIEPYAGGTEGTSVSADGVYSEIIKCGSTNAYLGLDPTTGFDGVLEYLYIIPLSSGPVAHCTGSQSAASVLYSLTGRVTAGDYKSAFTIDNRSAGSVKTKVGNVDHDYVSSDGDYERYITNDDAGWTRLYLITDANFTGDITALSAKEVTRHAQGTMLVALTPGFDKGDFGGTRNVILALQDSELSLLYLHGTNGKMYSYDGALTASQSALSYAANTTYLIAVQWGDTISNVNYFRIGAVALDTPWTSAAYGSDAEFDGAYTLGTDLNLFYSKFGSNNLRDLMFFDRILTDKEIEHFRKQIN
jgi:hypothetical protein